MATENHELAAPSILNSRISRGDEPELGVELEEIEDMYVQDQEDNKIRFGDIYKTQKTIVIFIRNFLCYMCKEYVDDLATIPEEHFRNAGVKLVVIGCSPTKFIQNFKDETGFKYPLYTDPDGALYKKLGCVDVIRPISMAVKDHKHVKTGLIMGTFKSTWRAMKFTEWQGNYKQQGASLIIGPGNQIHHVHLDSDSMDSVPINDLLKRAGVGMINFKKDRRVFET